MDVRRMFFRYRSYTPIPFLIAMVIFAYPTATSLAAGFGVVLFGEAIRLWGVSIAGSETRTTGEVGGTFLITSGPFAYVRNPLYVGNMTVYAGVGIMSNALFPWLLAAAVVFFYIQYTLIVSQEEEYLTQTFGETFDHYTSNVRRFFPRISPYESPVQQQKELDIRAGLSSEKRTLQAIGLVALVLVGIYVAGN